MTYRPDNLKRTGVGPSHHPQQRGERAVVLLSLFYALSFPREGRSGQSSPPVTVFPQPIPFGNSLKQQETQRWSPCLCRKLWPCVGTRHCASHMDHTLASEQLLLPTVLPPSSPPLPFTSTTRWPGAWSELVTE